MPVEPYAGDIEPASSVEPYEGELDAEPTHASRSALEYGAAGALGAGAAFLGRGLLRRYFPGVMPKTSALREIDQAIKRGDSKSGLRPMFGQYLREVSRTDKPITFADYVAQQEGHHEAVSTIKRLLGNSGQIAPIERGLVDRAVDSKSRVLQDIAGALGVPQQSLSDGLERLRSAKMTRAQPLYDAAFADKSPIRDTKLLDLFGTKVPNMAMMNALRERLKTLALQGKEPPTLMAADPRRRDAWKRLLTTEVPDQMFTGKDWAKLREFYAPGVEDLHHMRGNLWDLYQQAKKAGDNEKAKAYLGSWRGLTDYLDNATSGTYKQAREAYKGDSDLENAYRVGSELLTMKPDEVTQSIKGMDPMERQALSMGFYGGLQDMKTNRMLRELVRRPNLYPETQQTLSAVFTDPTRLRQFLQNLEGERAMSDSVGTFSAAPASTDPVPRALPHLRIYDPMTGVPHIGGGTSGIHANLFETVNPHWLVGKRPAWGSGRAARYGTDFNFAEPSSINPAMHPRDRDLYDVDLSPLEIAKRAAKWTGAGGAGGLGVYGARQLPSIDYPTDDPYTGQ